MKTQAYGERRGPQPMPAYRRQVEAFRRKFGREMAPDDPFFFDPGADTPQFRPPDDAGLALNVLVELMADAGLDPEFLYAVKRTGGLLPTPKNVLPADEQREWDAAISEYRTLLRRARKQ
jgi:hypothetical protein